MLQVDGASIPTLRKISRDGPRLSETGSTPAGHAAFLEAARRLGDYLLVGVHGDSVVSRRRGDGFPVMNLQERVLSVLARAAERNRTRRP